MGRVLLLLLVLLGVASWIVTAHPQWIIYGLFMGLLPGLVMMVLPGVFLGLLVFSILWRLARFRLGAGQAGAVALPLSIALFFVAGVIARGDAPARFAAAAALKDIVPGDRIALAGDIRLLVPDLDEQAPPPNVIADYRRRQAAYESRQAAWWAEVEARAKASPPDCNPQPCVVSTPVHFPESPPVYPAYARRWKCDALCSILLAAPGVTSVTVDSHGEADRLPAGLSERAATFRLHPHAICQKPGAAMMDPDACIIEDAPASTPPAFTIAWLHYWRPHQPPPHASGWSFDPDPIYVQRLMIMDGRGRPLLRQSRTEIPVIKVPLMILYNDGPRKGFGWWRGQLSNRAPFDDFRAEPLLTASTNIGAE